MQPFIHHIHSLSDKKQTILPHNRSFFIIGNNNGYSLHKRFFARSSLCLIYVGASVNIFDQYFVQYLLRVGVCFKTLFEKVGHIYLFDYTRLCGNLLFFKIKVFTFAIFYTTFRKCTQKIRIDSRSFYTNQGYGFW